jgi:3-hydroxyacyl-CoA dehydrogenase/enoyl-CoA hydratase/3-hydroxybutyryl-CoA epimerase
MNDITFKHWQIDINENNIAWLTLRYANGTTNVLAYAVMQELQTILIQYTTQLPRGLIIQSGYTNGFIAGADINEFLELKTTAQAYERLRFGQQVFAQLAKLPCPTVALINGNWCACGVRFNFIRQNCRCKTSKIFRISRCSSAQTGICTRSRILYYA